MIKVARFLVLSALAAPVIGCVDAKREWVRTPDMAGVPGDPESDNAQCAYEANPPGATSSRGRVGRSAGARAPGTQRASVAECMRARGWAPKPASD